jgi:hypothetical protein
MKVALMLTGLARKVQEGYEQYWKHVIDSNDVDLYLHCWKDEDWESVKEVYPKCKVVWIQDPIKFTKEREGIESLNDDKSRPLEAYDVYGNFRTFPMFYSWQRMYNHINWDFNYDCVIRSRYDLTSSVPLDLTQLDLNKINVSNHHWPNSENIDDNLCITNQKLADVLFKDVFDEYIAHSKKEGFIEFAEKSFMNILKRKGLWENVVKTNHLPFQLLRDNKLWYDEKNK